MQIQDLQEEVAFLTEQAKNGKRQNKLLKLALAKTTKIFDRPVMKFSPLARHFAQDNCENLLQQKE
jgi:hypothetical protein